MRVGFIHGFAGRIDDARTKGILNREVEFYSECLRQGVDPVVLTPDDAASAELVSAGVTHLPIGSPMGTHRIASQRRRLRAAIASAGVEATVADITAAPLVLGAKWRSPMLCRYEWYWSKVSQLEDRVIERMLKQFLETRMIRRSELVLSSTRALADEARRRGARQTEIAPVFVTSPFFDAGLNSVKNVDGMIRLLCVGRHVAVKRFDVALSAVAQSVHKDRLQLDLVGTGPESDRLRGVASTAGINLVEHGVVDNDLLPRLFGESHALLHPSLNEGMPRAILEAMAAGLPVFAGRSPGTEEILGPDGERGTLVGDSATDWTQAIDSAVETGALTGAPANSTSVARQWASETVSVSACVRMYVTALQRVVQ